MHAKRAGTIVRKEFITYLCKFYVFSVYSKKETIKIYLTIKLVMR